MLSSNCDRCEKPTQLGDTYGAGFPNREGMWGRDYVTILEDLHHGGDPAEPPKKWEVQIGIYNNSLDTTICASCVLDVLFLTLIQTGKIGEQDGHDHGDAGEHPDVHEVSAAPDVPATGADNEPRDSRYFLRSQDHYYHEHDGDEYIEVDTENQLCVFCQSDHLRRPG